MQISKRVRSLSSLDLTLGGLRIPRTVGVGMLMAGGVLASGASGCDEDGDGYLNCELTSNEICDCNDKDPSIYPGAPELANNQDNDCDTLIDEKHVTTCTDLQNMALSLASLHQLTNDLDCMAATQSSSGALYNGGAGFRPVGNRSAPFTGRLEGQDHTIRGLTINRPGESNVGLFGALSGGSSQVKDLTLKDVQVTGSANVGALVGYHDLGTLSRIGVSGTVIGTGSRVGGIGGEFYNSGGVTSARFEGYVRGGSEVGGIAGRAWDGNLNTFKQVQTAGEVGGTSMVGGLVGYNKSADFLECFSTAKVTGDSQVGGLMGYTTENAGLEDAWYRGKVVGKSTVGGLIGWLGSYDHGMHRALFAGTVSGQSQVGALAGSYSAGKVSASFWDKTLNPTLPGVGAGSSPQGISGQPTDVLMKQATFEDAGWNFGPEAAIWEMCSYPCLVNNPEDGCETGGVIFTINSQSQTGSSYSIGRTGTDLVKLADLALDSTHIDIDTVNGRLYYARWWTTPQLWVSDLNGENMKPIEGCGHASEGGGGIAVDPQAGYLFYGNYYGNLYRCTLDASGLKGTEDRLLISKSLLPEAYGVGDVKLDTLTGQVYFASTASSNPSAMSLYRADYNGQGLVTLYKNLGHSWSFVPSHEDNLVIMHAYNSVEDHFQRVVTSLNGEEVSTVFDFESELLPIGAAYDAVTHEVYFLQTNWNDYTPCALMVSDLKGEHAQTLAVLSGGCGDLELEPASTYDRP